MYTYQYNYDYKEEIMFQADNSFDLIVIKAYIKVNKLTKAKFCEQCGISLDILNKVYSNKKDILLCDLIKISNTLKIPVASLFKCEYHSRIQTRFIL